MIHSLTLWLVLTPQREEMLTPQREGREWGASRSQRLEESAALHRVDHGEITAEARDESPTNVRAKLQRPEKASKQK